MLVETPQNASYMWAGYAVGLGILLAYTGSLWLRVGKAVSDKR